MGGNAVLRIAWKWVKSDPTRALFVGGVALVLGGPIHFAMIQSIPRPESTPQTLSMDLMKMRLMTDLAVADGFVALIGAGMILLAMVNRSIPAPALTKKSKRERYVAAFILAAVSVFLFALRSWFRKSL